MQSKIIALYLHSQTGQGRLAQLVQSTCLTSRGSLVRTQYLPQRSLKRKFWAFFMLLLLWSVPTESGIKRKSCGEGNKFFTLRAYLLALEYCRTQADQFTAQGIFDYVNLTDVRKMPPAYRILNIDFSILTLWNLRKNRPLT